MRDEPPKVYRCKIECGYKRLWWSEPNASTGRARRALARDTYRTVTSRDASRARRPAAWSRDRIIRNPRSPEGTRRMKSFTRRSAAVALFGVFGLTVYVGCQVAPVRHARTAANPQPTARPH